MGVRFEDLSLDAQAQALRKLGDIGEGKKKTAKYKNTRTECAGITFDSKKEERRYEYLICLERSGEIRDLRLQQDFTLQEAYTTKEGERIRAIRYRADFTYFRRSGTGRWERVVEDVKSHATRTREYINKRKMMQDRFGIMIEEV